MREERIAGYATGPHRPRERPARPAIALTCDNAFATPPRAERVLVVRLGAVGDVVRTLPAARRLRAAYPRAHLAWLVEPPSASLLESQPWIDEVIVFPRRELARAAQRLHWVRAARRLQGFAARLRAGRFDLVVDFHTILKSGALAWLSGAPRRAGYARPYGRELGWVFATARARLSPRRASRFERNAGLVRFLGIDAADAGPPLVLDPAAAARARSALGPEPAPVAIHPGTSPHTPHKRYSVAGYAALARALREGDGIGSIVTSGPAPEERELASRVVEASAGAARLAPPTARLADLAALLARCRLYVGSDTGPLHIASLVGTPVVQILGPTDPVENAPYPGTPSRTLRVPVPCSPCRRGCAAATCIRRVRPESVIEAARSLLVSQPGEPVARPARGR